MPFNIIALWLGHESTNATHRYVDANLAMKEKALARLEAPGCKPTRFRASDELMKFLQALQLSKEPAGSRGMTPQKPAISSAAQLYIVELYA